MRIERRAIMLLGFSNLILSSLFQILCVVNCAISYPDLNYKVRFVEILSVNYNLVTQYYN